MSRFSTRRHLLRPLVALAAGASLSACTVLPGSDSDAVALERALSESDPTEFAQGFVSAVQPGTDYAVYEQFLHPNLRVMLDRNPGAKAHYFSNAQAENELIEDLGVFQEAKVEHHPQQFNDQYHVVYELPSEANDISIKQIYPKSPLAGRGKTLSTGQVVLVEAEGGWRVVYHQLQ